MKLAFIYSMPLSRQWALGTLLSSFPLLAAVGYAIWSIEQHNQRQQSLVDTAIVVNRQLVELQDEVKELERSARQFAVLQDARMESIFREKLENLTQLTSSFLAAVDSGNLQQQIRRLLELLREDLLIVASPETQTEALQRLTQVFEEVARVQTRIADISQQVVSDQLQDQKESFASSQVYLALLGLLALPSSLIFQLIWAWLISKPMNQLSHTIGRLGRGDLDYSVELDGPQELKILAERLEWLRSNLKSIEAQKNRLLRHVTHELKTPLAAIFEASSLLQEQVAGPLNADQLAVIKILSENAERLQEMITQLLNFNSARLTEQDQLQQVDVIKLARAVQQQYDNLIESRNIKLEMPSTNMQVLTDPTLFEMILSNLLSNALNFSPAGSEVTISWTKNQHDWWVEVTDQGPGIPEIERDRVFRPFFQGANKRSGSTKGTGLGLAIVSECVNQLKGDISFTDWKPQGTCMKVTFTQTEPVSDLENLVCS